LVAGLLKVKPPLPYISDTQENAVVRPAQVIVFGEIHQEPFAGFGSRRLRKCQRKGIASHWLANPENIVETPHVL
jgi:hypothetical protein